VEKKRQEDAANGIKIAKSLEGFLERKVCLMCSIWFTVCLSDWQ